MPTSCSLVHSRHECSNVPSYSVFIPFAQRRDFITGIAEPTDAEAEWHSENEEEEKLAVSMDNLKGFFLKKHH